MKMARIWSPVTVFAVLVTVAIGLVSSKPPGDTFNKFGLRSLQYHDGTLYIGAGNFLYKLNEADLSKKPAKIPTNCGLEYNDNKILLLNDRIDGSPLITCGTGCDGRCEMRAVDYRDVNESLSAIVSTKRDSTALGMVLPQGFILVATSYGDEMNGDSSDDNCYPAINTRCTHGDCSVFDISSHILNFSKDYEVEFKSMMYNNDQSLTHVLSTQRDVSTLWTVSHVNTSAYRAASPVCRHENVAYTSMQDAVLLKKNGTDAFLVGSFNRRVKKNKVISVLCMTHVNTILDESSSINNRCIDSKVEGTTLEMTYAGFNTSAEETITKLNASTIHGSGVLLVGTSKGNIIKFVMLGDGTLHKIEGTETIPGNKPVVAIHQKTEGNYDFFAMTEQRVKRFQHTNCSLIESCAAMKMEPNPVCGWCVFQGNATTRDKCKGKWILSTEDCVSIEINPNTAQSNKTVTLHVTLTGLNLSEVNFKQWYCQVSTVRVNATSDEYDDGTHAFSCSIPGGLATKLGTVDVFLMVQVEGTDIKIAKDSLQYQICGYWKSCDKCSNTEGCVWNVNNIMCEQKELQNNVTKPDCPTINIEKNLVHVGENVTINVNASFSAMDFQFECMFGNRIHQTCESKDNNTITCPVIETMVDRKEELPITVFYNKTEDRKASFQTNLKVTVYNCSGLGPTFSYCGALKSMFGCHWRKNVSCEKADADDSVQPNPKITEILPNTGTAGVNNQEFVIYGDDFGYGNTCMPFQAIFGNASCPSKSTIKENLPDDADFQDEVYAGFKCGLRLSGDGGTVNLTVSLRTGSVGSDPNNAPTFSWKKVNIMGINPSSGPKRGGTVVTFTGENIGVGTRAVENIEFKAKSSSTNTIKCRNPVVKAYNGGYAVECVMGEAQATGTVSMTTFKYDTVDRTNASIQFEYMENPEVNTSAISRTKGFLSGGLDIFIHGSLLNNSNTALLALPEDATVTSTCQKTSDTLVCSLPNANDVYSDAIANNSGGARRKRSATLGDIEVMIYIQLDGQNVPFTLTYYHDPVITGFGNDVTLYADEVSELFIKGNDINLVVDEIDVNVTIGLAECTVFNLTGTGIKCMTPLLSDTGISDGEDPEVNVQIGNYKVYVGRIKYEQQTQQHILIFAASGGSFLAIVVIVAIFGVLRYRRVANRKNEYKDELYKLEDLVKTEARSEFGSMTLSMQTVSKSLVEQGFPYHGYQQFACNAMFAADYLLSEPVLCMGKTDTQASRYRRGMEKFEKLLENKFFLVSVLTTMDKQRHFFIREKADLAGNMCAIFMGRMDYMQEVMEILLANVVKTSSSKRGIKSLFRRCEGLTEKLLSNWLSLCLYPYIKDQSGLPLYLLYVATQKTIHNGPIDAVTGAAKYTLSEEALLKKIHDASDEPDSREVQFEAKTLVLKVVVDPCEEVYDCHVLDCDTITQVKVKCLEQIYVNYPASELDVDPSEIVLEWQAGFGGRMILQDEDNTSSREDGWVRLNTLAHYNVPDNSNMVLVDPKGALEDYANTSHVVIGMGAGEKDSKRLIVDDDGEEVEEAELIHWHLVRNKDKQTHKKPGKRVIDELYLNRLFTTKHMLSQYTEALFNMVLDKDTCPPPVKFLFDLLDDLGQKHKVDADVVHSWKSHSYPIRVWGNLIRSPAVMFDVNVPSYVANNLEVISNVFIESFSTSKRQIAKDSPSERILFHNEIESTKTKVKTFFDDVQKIPADKNKSRQYIDKVNKLQQSTNFNKAGALYRLFLQMRPYEGDILQDLSQLKDAESLKLDMRMREIFSFMPGDMNKED